MSDELNGRSWVARQKRFYATLPHDHLQYAPDSVYGAKLSEQLLQLVPSSAASRILEVGCGAGRFTLHLLQRFPGNLVALDLSEALLDQLRAKLRELPEAARNRCQVVSGDLHHLDGTVIGQGGFDAIIGFFFLHHLDQLTDALRQLRRWLRPGGRMVFLEPNRRNPLFLLQVLCCPDMSWSEEQGMFRLGRARIRSAFNSAGMSMPTIRTFGCFPPQILDRWDAALRVEHWIERQAFCRPMLPFRLIESHRLEDMEERLRLIGAAETASLSLSFG